MKKGVIFILLLLLISCKNNEKNKRAASKEAEVKKVEKNIELSRVPENLPDYSEIRGDKIYEELLIIYPEGHGGHVASRTVFYNIVKKYGFKSKMIKESEVSKEELLTHNLLLIGDKNSNRVIKELYEYLPIKFDENGIEMWGEKFPGEKLGINYFYPNLYNVNRSMIIMMGSSDESYKLYDYKKYDIAVSYDSNIISPMSFKEFAFANFESDWSKKEIRVIEEKELDTGEEDKLELGELKSFDFPEWAKGAVIYQLFLRSFSDSDGDGKGDLKGLKNRLNYLSDLGVDIIWLNPIFESPSYHGYDMKDYMAVDEDYGTIEDFEELVEGAKSKNIKIILDIAFNHSSKMEKHFRDAYGNPESKYDRWFYFSNIQNTMYHDWYFRDNPKSRDTVNSNMPAWNTNNPEVIDYHFEILKYWIDKGVAGFRMDVAKGPNHSYWKALRQKVKSYNRDTLLLGEAWVDVEEYKPYFDNEFDSIFDFTLQGSMTSGVFGDIIRTLKREEELGIGKNMARFMSNHDMDRFPTYIPKERLKLYGTLLFTLNGMPTLYYGDELGTKGDGAEGDRGRRRPFEWKKDNSGEDMTTWYDVYSEEIDGISVEEQSGVEGSYLEEYKKLIKIRREYRDIFATGEIKLIDVVKESGKKSRRTLSYFVGSGDKKALVILNFEKRGSYRFDFLGESGEYKEVLSGGESIILSGDEKLNLERNRAYIYIKK